MIKAFIFDLGNVIVAFDHNKTARRLEEVCEFTSDEIFARAISSQLVQEYNLGKISSAEFFDELNRQLNLQMSFTDFFQAWNCTFAPEPIISEQIIKTLSEKYRLLILSDTNEMHFDFIRENFPILNYFDDFVVSHKVSAAKPSSQIFKAVVKIADCLPKECFFVDDLAVNVAGAKDFGLNAIQFISAKQFEEELKTRNLI